MGYTARNLRANTISKAITEDTTFCSNVCYQMTGTTEEIFYKQTHDLTNVDYLELTCITKQTGASGTLTLYFDTTSKGTITVDGGALLDADAIKNITVDCTSITGNQIIKLGLVNSNPAGTSFVVMVTIFARES